MLVFSLLRMFWLTELALLLVVFIGLRSGWSTPRQWSDGFFVAAAGQVLVAAMWIANTSSMDMQAASTLRYVSHGDMAESVQELFLDTLHKQTLGMRAFIGAVLTLLIALIALRF